MKNKRFTWMSLIVIMVLVLTACARPAVTEETAEPIVVEQPATEEPTAIEEPTATDAPTATEAPEVEETEVEETEAPVADEDELDDEDERMKALISEKIENCHVLNFVLRRSKTREEWSTTLDRMIGYGANINAEEKEQIIDWLVSRDQ